MGVKNVDDVMRQTNAAMEEFEGFRNDGSKRASFRSAMGNHLGDLQICIDGFQAAADGANAFPLVPVGLVVTAASRLISVSINTHYTERH